MTSFEFDRAMLANERFVKDVASYFDLSIRSDALFYNNDCVSLCKEDDENYKKKSYILEHVSKYLKDKEKEFQKDQELLSKLSQEPELKDFFIFQEKSGKSVFGKKEETITSVITNVNSDEDDDRALF